MSSAYAECFHAECLWFDLMLNVFMPSVDVLIDVAPKICRTMIMIILRKKWRNIIADLVMQMSQNYNHRHLNKLTDYWPPLTSTTKDGTAGPVL